jgi:hypothetical protein
MILHLICEFRTLSRTYTVRSYASHCPTNFPGAHSTPTAETAVIFELRESDTLNETGMLFSTTTVSS